MSGLTAKDLVEVNIPRSFRVDGKPFTYFLRKNGVDFIHHEVEEFHNFRFLSSNAADRAAAIWENLTGGKLLGHLPSWKQWKDFTS